MKQKKTNKRDEGFTLIELLITIAIIGILAAVVLVNLNSSRQQSRNVKRLADVRELMTAFQLFYNDNGRYPLPDTPSATGPDINDGDPTWSTFLLAWPTAPEPPDNPSGVSDCDATTNQYTYTQLNLGEDYNVTFCLGDTVGDYGPGIHTLSATGID